MFEYEKRYYLANSKISYQKMADTCCHWNIIILDFGLLLVLLKKRVNSVFAKISAGIPNDKSAFSPVIDNFEKKVYLHQWIANWLISLPGNFQNKWTVPLTGEIC